MNRLYKLTLLVLCIFSLFIGTAFAADSNSAEVDEIRPQITASGFSDDKDLTDGKWATYATAKKGNSIVISCPEGIDYIYIEYDQPSENTWTLTNMSTGRSVVCGQELFLHQYKDLKEVFGSSPAQIKLEFAEGDILTDVYAFHGQTPDWVQIWKPCLEKADLMLITTHADDEQLFFAGLLPYYCMERKLDVQVVYFIQHFHKAHRVFNHLRQHELLSGLWEVGVRNYPFISEFPDAYAEGETKQEALNRLMNSFKYYGYKYDDFQKYVVDVFRRFKPLVVVTHDLDGEYGHPAHVLNAEVTTKAVELSGDPEKYPESAQEYGTWVPKKLYVHLYNKNTITMDWDTPYESMGGKTPFQKTQDGFNWHASQHPYWFWRWLNNSKNNRFTKATQIKTYSPCNYGLYFTSVGEDVAKNDMMENIKTYGQERAEKEAEEARKRAEEEARQEAERKAREEEERRREEAERQRAAEERRQTIRSIIFIGVALILAAVIILYLHRAKKKKHK